MFSDYYKSNYYNIINVFENKLQKMQEKCSKKSLTKSIPPILEVTNDQYKDVYQVLSEWIETSIEWCMTELHYKIGKVLTNNANAEDITSACKECFREQHYYLDTFGKINEQEKNNNEVIEKFITQ